MDSLDFRSDTVTRPDEAMRHAIAHAEVGDDVFVDDPTVLRMEERVAELLGKEAALFVASGTMSNQVALAIHTRHGDQILLEADSHIYHYEGGGPAALSGLWPTLVSGRDGELRWPEVEAALAIDDPHLPKPSLVCLENTHNRAGGTIISLESIQEVGDGCRERKLAFHLDGARIWNASIASGIALDQWCAPFDTISVCFSKGLGAPVGSCLAGTASDMALARRIRKRFGGGMRQVGLLAAACLHALDHNLARLAEDHANAQLIASRLDHPRMRIFAPPQTNILLVDLDEDLRSAEVLSVLAEAGVLGVAFGPRRIRLTTHKDLSRADCERALTVLNGLEL